MAPFNFHLLLVSSFNFENVVLSLNQCPGHCNYFAHLLWHLLFMNCYRWYVRKSSYTWYTQSLYLVLIAVLQAFLFGFIMLRPCYAQKLICVHLFVTPWSLQASLSLGFSRQEYWRELPFLPPGDLPDPGIKAMSLKPPALADGFFTTEPPGKPQHAHAFCTYTRSPFSDQIFLLELLKNMFYIISWLWQSVRMNAVKAKRKEQQKRVNANNKILNQN